MRSSSTFRVNYCRFGSFASPQCQWWVPLLATRVGCLRQVKVGHFCLICDTIWCAIKSIKTAVDCQLVGWAIRRKKTLRKPERQTERERESSWACEQRGIIVDLRIISMRPDFQFRLLPLKRLYGDYRRLLSH